MRIVLVNRRLGPGAGGAERVLSLLGNHWVRAGNEVAIVTFDDGRPRPFYPLDEQIRLLPLACGDPRRFPAARGVALGQRVAALRRLLRRQQPEIVVSFQTNVNVETLLAAVGLSIPVIASERNDPEQLPLGNPLRRRLRDLVYPRAAALVVQTVAARDRLPARLLGRMHVIPNPVSKPAAPGHLETSGEESPRIVAMGRLVRQKGFDVLLECMARLKSRHPRLKLTVLGEGPDRSQLEQRRDALGLAGRVDFPGLAQFPEPILRQSDLFVLSSRFEGFPNALCEAMACGLAVVATDCPSGPAEIVRREIDGLLVPPEDVDAMTAAVDRLLTDDSLRREMGRRATEVAARFRVDEVLAIWDRLLERVTHEQR